MATRIKWRDQYDDEADAIARAASNSDNYEPSMTQQSWAKDTDLNEIVRRFGITDGAIPAQAADPRYYGDFTDTVDLTEALARIKTAYEHFDSLPAELRTRFDNDPVELYKWVNDPANVDEAVELKILSKEGAAAVPRTADERRALEVEKLQQRIKDLETAATAVPPPPAPPAA